MRYALLLLLVPTLLATGCSLAIVKAGRDPHEFGTREGVHRKFGEPMASKNIENGGIEEDFHARGKYAEVMRSLSMGMGWAMTFGAAELICLPVEVCRLVKRTVFGQTLRYTFNADGTIAYVTILTLRDELK